MWQTIKHKLSQWKGILLIISCIAGLTIIGSNAGFFRIMEWVVQDQFLRLRSQDMPEDRIVIVTVDEADIKHVKQWPMSDRVMAKMIRSIQSQQPRAIAIDIYRDLPVKPGHKELVNVFKTTPNIIGIQKAAGKPVAPPPTLNEIGQVAANDLSLDADGKIRRGFVIVPTEKGDVIQGLGVKMALTYLEKEGIELEAIDENQKIYGLGQAKFSPLSSQDGEYNEQDLGGYQILLNYRGGLQAFTHISMTDVLENRIPDNFMRDRLIFIGAKAPSLNDSYPTPFNNALLAPTYLMPGVVIHANLASQIISSAMGNQPMLRPAAKPINWLWILAWTAGSTALGSYFIQKRWLTIIGLLAAVTIIVVAAILAFYTGWVIQVFTPLVAVGSAAVASIGYVLWKNLMLSYRKLEDYAQNLKNKVRERTAKLAQANQEISILNEKLEEENLRMSAELDVARQIQQMILPKQEELMSIEDIDIAGYMVPAEEVGGDYYDVLNTNGIITIGIGDVTGHGLESGLLMLMTQTAVRTLKELEERDPVRFLDALNRTIYHNVQRMGSERNLTLAILNYSQGRVNVSGQHEETLVVRAGGEVERIDTIDLGLPIGLDDDIVDFIDHKTIDLNPGDGLVLYTDGIPEAYNISKEQYGMQRMCDVISQSWSGSAEESKQAIINDVRHFIGEQKVFDDITLVVLKQK